MSFVSKNLDKIKSKAIKRMERQGQKALDVWYDYLVKKSSEPKSGNEYTHMINGRLYTWTASDPGEFPAIVTGNLLTTKGLFGDLNSDRGYPRSLYRFVSVSAKQIRITLRLTIPYAVHVEAKRPLLAQARADCKDEIVRILTS